MKKILTIFVFGFALMFSFGCSDDVEQYFYNLSNGDEKVIEDDSSANNITMQELYEKLRNENDQVVVNMLMNMIVEDNFDLSEKEYESFYNQTLNEIFAKNITSNSEYFINGNFNEEFAMLDLQAKGFDIVCGETTTYNLDENLECNFDDYIKNDIEPKILEKILMTNYIIQEQENLIENFPLRKIEYFQIDKETLTINEGRDKLISFLDDIEKGHISDFSEIESILKNDEILEIYNNFQNLTNPTDSGYLSALDEFSKCGDKVCDVYEGYNYQIDEVNKKEYSFLEFINSDSKIFSDNISRILFSDDVEDHLIEIGEHYYLTAPFSNLEKLSLKDAAIYERDSETFFLIRVDIMDEKSSKEDYLKAVSTLNDKININTVLNHYLEEYEIEFFEDILKNQLKDNFNIGG